MCPQQMLRARANGETFVSATMCPATLCPRLRCWQTRTHCCRHIVAHDVSWVGKRAGTQNICFVSMPRKRGNICCGHKMFLTKIRNIFCVSDTNFVSATNVARTGKRGNIYVRNNVSATLCPRLPPPLPPP